MLKHIRAFVGRLLEFLVGKKHMVLGRALCWTHCHKPQLGDGEQKELNLMGVSQLGGHFRSSCSAMMPEKKEDGWRRKNGYKV